MLFCKVLYVLKLQVLTNCLRRSYDVLNMSANTSSLYNCCRHVKDIFVKLLLVKLSENVGILPVFPDYTVFSLVQAGQAMI